MLYLSHQCNTENTHLPLSTSLSFFLLTALIEAFFQVINSLCFLGQHTVTFTRQTSREELALVLAISTNGTNVVRIRAPMGKEGVHNRSHSSFQSSRTDM